MRQQIEKNWLARVTRDDRIRRIEVSSVSVDGDKSVVGKYADVQGLDTEALSDEMMRDAVNFAAGLGGVQRFVVSAIDGDDEAVWRTAFNIDGGSYSEGDATVSEPPNAVGLTSQLMRHLESKDRTINSMAGTYVHAMADTIKELRAENASLRDKEIQRAAITEELLSKKHERELVEKQVQAKIDREGDMWAKAQQWLPALIPHVIGKLTGNSPFIRPVASDIEVAALGLAEGIKGDEIENMITKGASPQVMAALMVLLEQVNKAKAISLKEQAEIGARQESQRWETILGGGGKGSDNKVGGSKAGGNNGAPS